ncbi:uncharacterized protein MONBRDRAFT_28750 [Monosiga brevicollis MX1]|uniref:Rab-GAP TBC domain-containing protein n=1 Tax=Monosiga brevicollis TaxID=81824 RepID=A9V930_MONBE|nr:uncharacterized protein MONBRDRAFT_28750 [Monosiga brevicollis MX1]EDQ86059.1 predicted protein [Monosiga brevicollis MX1]|eukprot:XP_001749253.1 hypothetical protein [Monosiga brevicollis MX1]
MPLLTCTTAHLLSLHNQQAKSQRKNTLPSGAPQMMRHGSTHYNAKAREDVFIVQIGPDDRIADPEWNAWLSPLWFLPKMDNVWQALLGGCPHDLRRQVWLRATRAPLLRQECPLRYDELVACGGFELETTESLVQMRKDLLRTFPDNILFQSLESEAVARLRRILTATAWYRPDIGYCQGLGMLVGWATLIMEEEEAFWFIQALLREHVSDDYYGSTLLGAMADQQVLRELVRLHLPRVHDILEEYSIELSLITLNWFITIFAGVAPTHFTLRIWDCYVFDGRLSLFKAEDTAAVLNAISEAPNMAHSPDEIIKLSYAFQFIEEDLQQLVDDARQQLRVHFDDYKRRLLARRAEQDTPATKRASAWNWFSRSAQRDDRLIKSADAILHKLGETMQELLVEGRKPTRADLNEAADRLADCLEVLLLHGLQFTALPLTPSLTKSEQDVWLVCEAVSELLRLDELELEGEPGLCETTEVRNAETALCSLVQTLNQQAENEPQPRV